MLPGTAAFDPRRRIAPARLRREEGGPLARQADLGCRSADRPRRPAGPPVHLGRGPDVIANRPCSVIVIILFIGTVVVFGLLAIEATDNPTPRTLAPADLYRYTATGVVVRDPAYVGVDVAQFNQLAGTEAFKLFSFDSKEERDRAAGELIGESGLLIQGSMAGGAG